MGTNNLFINSVPIIAPSMMSADIALMRETLAVLERGGVKLLHIDVMDGDFVPNIALGTEYCKQMRKLTSIPLDIHLMINNPEGKIAYFDPQPSEIVSVHVEAASDLKESIDTIKSFGALAFAVINPETPVKSLSNYLGIVDGVLVMSVHPGFSGQSAIPECIEKAAQVRSMLDEIGRTTVPVEIDGGVAMTTLPQMKITRASIYVCGSSLFPKVGSENYLASLEANLKALTNLVAR